MTALISVAPHTRKKPYQIEREAKTAQLLSEVEARVDRQVSAAFKTFAINVWRAEARGALGGA